MPKSSIAPSEANPDAAQMIVDAAARLAALRPWYKIALTDIAAEAGVGLDELSRLYPSRCMLLGALIERIDRTALAQKTDPVESSRERLFEALMARFDALRPYRQPLRDAAAALSPRRLGLERLDAAPAGLIALLHLPRAMAWTLEAAGIAVTGVKGLARTKLLGLAYLAVFRVWLEDDSVDLGKTMAALDRALHSIEPWLALSPAAAPKESAA
jgi:AcrR family transcriptional regulator